jgi:hypothetical protein
MTTILNTSRSESTILMVLSEGEGFCMHVFASFKYLCEIENNIYQLADYVISSRMSFITLTIFKFSNAFSIKAYK